MTRPQTPFPDHPTRYTPQPGLRLVIQIPQPDVRRVLDAITATDPLRYGDYDQVSFETQSGQQRFRALGTGRNTATDSAVSVPCAELSVFLADDPERLDAVLRAIYDSHPYEEPVILIQPCWRSCHVRGLDEDNPNRFWNRAPADWVPGPHRGPDQSKN
ncbi:MAG: hypothetical protein OIF47_10305 [Marinibacterium sp.]|nr:hypothetical protein [Marinibacterium sp.]